MNNTRHFTLDSSVVKLKEILNKDFLEIEIYAIAEGENNNHSNFTLNSMKKSIPSFYNKFILGYFKDNDIFRNDAHFEEHNSEVKYDQELEEYYYSYLSPTAEKALGIIRESDKVEIVDYKGKKWIKLTAAILTKYNREAVKYLLKSRRKNKVSVEITVNKWFVKDGVEIIEDFTLDGITLLGTRRNSREECKEGIEGACMMLNFLQSEVFNTQKKALSFAYKELEKEQNNFIQIPSQSTNELEQEITMEQNNAITNEKKENKNKNNKTERGNSTMKKEEQVDFAIATSAEEEATVSTETQANFTQSLDSTTSSVSTDVVSEEGSQEQEKNYTKTEENVEEKECKNCSQEDEETAKEEDNCQNCSKEEAEEEEQEKECKNCSQEDEETAKEEDNCQNCSKEEEAEEEEQEKECKNCSQEKDEEDEDEVEDDCCEKCSKDPQGVEGDVYSFITEDDQTVEVEINKEGFGFIQDRFTKLVQAYAELTEKFSEATKRLENFERIEKLSQLKQYGLDKISQEVIFDQEQIQQVTESFVSKCDNNELSTEEEVDTYLKNEFAMVAYQQLSANKTSEQEVFSSKIINVSISSEKGDKPAEDSLKDFVKNN